MSDIKGSFSDNLIIDGEIIVTVDASLFSKNAVLKALYWFGDKFHTTFGTKDHNKYLITLKPLHSIAMEMDELQLYLQKLQRDLVDFELRESINAETKNVRDLLVAKAFSNGEFDEVPFGEVSDPVGFDPKLNMLNYG